MPGRKTRPDDKRGGARPGAGRPIGSKCVLQQGEVKALKAINLRIPKGTDTATADVANEALVRLVEVMREGVHYLNAPGVLKAATRLREEICNPLMQKVEHSGPDGGPVQVVVQKYGEDET